MGSLNVGKALDILSLRGRTAGGRLDIPFEELQKAYRLKALRIHPDLSEVLGLEKSRLEEEFKTVVSSYLLLKDYIEKGLPFKLGTSYYPGNVPKRKLRFGEFLYYNKHIDWDTLIRAVVWQARSRPRLGEIAVRGYLTRDNVIRILKKIGIEGKIRGSGFENGAAQPQ